MSTMNANVTSWGPKSKISAIPPKKSSQAMPIVKAPTAAVISPKKDLPTVPAFVPKAVSIIPAPAPEDFEFTVIRKVKILKIVEMREKLVEFKKEIERAISLLDSAENGGNEKSGYSDMEGEDLEDVMKILECQTCYDSSESCEQIPSMNEECLSDENERLVGIIKKNTKKLKASKDEKEIIYTRLHKTRNELKDEKTRTKILEEENSFLRKSAREIVEGDSQKLLRRFLSLKEKISAEKEKVVEVNRMHGEFILSSAYLVSSYSNFIPQEEALKFLSVPSKSIVNGLTKPNQIILNLLRYQIEISTLHAANSQRFRKLSISLTSAFKKIAEKRNIPEKEQIKQLSACHLTALPPKKDVKIFFVLPKKSNFIPGKEEQGQYDSYHVGTACKCGFVEDKKQMENQIEKVLSILEKED